ncbi:hypothetical protein BGX31_004914 [Mortierella sp. GBA43]|nr:hypothetical protein BGX31_004914 [Mortierella sp. GBA43]
MNCINRTTIILDHSPQARRRACHDIPKKPVAIDEDPNYDFDLEPASLWSSFVHASLHYARLTWDLSPVGQNSQASDYTIELPVSIHTAPGSGSTCNSVILNTWIPHEQTVGYVTSQLQLLNIESAQEDGEYSHNWVGPALQGAIAHILEPIALQSTSAIGSLHSGIDANIVMVLADTNYPDTGEQDVDMDSDTLPKKGIEQTDQPWRYGNLDLRGELEEGLQKFHESLKSSRYAHNPEISDPMRLRSKTCFSYSSYLLRIANIQVDFIRVTTDRTRRSSDIIKEEISRICSASFYTVVSADESSTEEALTNLYLLRNRNVELLRLHKVPIDQRSKGSPLDIFFRSDHIRVTPRKSTALQTLGPTLHDTPPNIQTFTEQDYGVECRKAAGSVHLLKTPQLDDVASMALYDHDGQLFVHCLHTTADPGTFFSSEATAPLSSKRKHDTYMSNSQVEEFVESILRPNTITSGTDLFAQEANSFIEIVPSTVRQKSTLQTEGEGIDYSAEDTPGSLGINLALVHSTSRLDLETRCAQIQKFKGAICKNTMDAVGLATIQGVLDALIADARPLVLPGEVPQGPTPPNLLRVRESAQAILADLWMIGQRFKSVSQSHVEAARLIATKITPKGLDHQTVKLTLVPPNRRSTLSNTETASPVMDGSDTSGDGWNRNKNPRGGGNVGSGRGGRGGRFDNNRGRGGGVGPAGRGRGGSGGFRGGHSGQGNASAGGDDLNFAAFDASTAGPTGDIMVSMTGKTQPVPYLTTQPPTREELEEAEQDYLAQLGDDGCLLKAYWGPRGAQGSSIATVLNSVTSLDSPMSNPNTVSGSTAPLRDPLAAVAMAAQQKMKKLAAKRPRLQDFAGRTPVAENGGHRP